MYSQNEHKPIQFGSQTLSLSPGSSLAVVGERDCLSSSNDVTKIRHLSTVFVHAECPSQVCSEFPGSGRAQVLGTMLQGLEER